MNLLMISGDTAAARGEQGPFYNTLSEFSRYWDAIDVITPPAPGAARRECFGNVALHPSPRPGAMQPFFILERGRELAAQRNYALIASHDYGVYLNGVGAARLSHAIGVPYVSEIHHVEGYPRAANLRERIQPALAQYYVRWARGRAKAFRVVNAGELKPLLESWGVPESQLLVLHSLYLDFDVFHPQDPPGPKEYDAMFCGRLAPNKAPMLFLESAALARKRLGRVRALIVGRGPLGPALRERARQLELDVEFCEWVETQPELAALYRRSRCLVCASYSEGGPRVVAEALACGVPVVASRVGLARELVRDGENGFQADWSAAELADRIAQIVSDEPLRSRMSAAAPGAVSQFEKSQVIREYAAGYQRLIA